MQLIQPPEFDLKKRSFTVIWETTQACDLTCRYCRIRANPATNTSLLSLEEGCHLIDEVVRMGSNRPRFVLTGGDPLKRSDIFELTAYSVKKGLPVGISPAATPLLTSEIFDRLKALGTRTVSLSLDGATATLHDNFRGVPGSFAWALQGWKAAHSAGLKIHIDTLVTRKNLYDLPALLALVRDMGALTWSVHFLVSASKADQADDISAEECEAVMNFLYDASKYVNIKTAEAPQYKRVVLQRTALDALGQPADEVLSLNETYQELMKGFRFVTTGRLQLPAHRVRRLSRQISSDGGSVFISQNGEVYPGAYLPLSVGNVRQTRLKEIYQDSPLLQSLRDKDHLEGRCGQCEFREICGGSRSRAYALNGRVMAEDPACIYQPGSFSYTKEVQDLLSVAA